VITVTDFTPVSALLGGALIGLSATALLWLNGRIAGISGIAFGAMENGGRERAWRLAFLAGLLAGAALWFRLRLFVPPVSVRFPPGPPVAPGLLVGIGTRLGSGCTSGHGICGLARFSRRSLVAVAVFMAVAMITTTILRHVLH